MRKLLLAALAAVTVSGAGAQSLDLGNYRLSASHALDRLGELGLEGSAVTDARDRGTLFFVGDERLGVVETSRTGQTLGSMTFDWTGTGSTHNDAEGLTYLGNGQLVVVEERLQRALGHDQHLVGQQHRHRGHQRRPAQRPLRHRQAGRRR